MHRPLVLVVEDEADIRETLVDYLRRALEGVAVVGLENADRAHKLLRLSHVDLLLSDHKMPGMSGAQLLQYVKDNHPSTVRMLMTAYPEQEVLLDACNDAHVDHIFTKPLDPTGLAARVAQSLERAGCYG